jgi:hypothetical protein
MRRLLIGTLTFATLAFGAAGAMAQSRDFPPPVPNASGSQTSAPSIYRNTANRDRQRGMMIQQRKLMGVMSTGSVSKKRHRSHH